MRDYFALPALTERLILSFYLAITVVARLFSIRALSVALYPPPDCSNHQPPAITEKPLPHLEDRHVSINYIDNFTPTSPASTAYIVFDGDFLWT